MNKRELRSKILGIRKNLGAEDKAILDEQIFEKLTGLDRIKNAEYVLAYASYNSEADTMKIIKHLLEDGKKVALPRVNGDNMAFYIIKSQDDLIAGYKGIPEPGNDCRLLAVNDAIQNQAVILVPGSAFDRRLYRMGYGKGYYDRYLADHESLTSIGLAYDCQLLDEIPIDNWDRRLDIIVTDREIVTYKSEPGGKYD